MTGVEATDPRRDLAVERNTTLPEPVTKPYGRYTVKASRTVEGGYAINTTARTTGYRYDELSFTTPDRDAYRLAYKVIGDGGNAQLQPEQIRENLREALTGELHAMQRRRDTPSRARVEHLNALLDLIDPISDEALHELTEKVSTAMAGVASEFPRPRTWANLRDDFADGMKRDRAARKAVA